MTPTFLRFSRFLRISVYASRLHSSGCFLADQTPPLITIAPLSRTCWLFIAISPMPVSSQSSQWAYPWADGETALYRQSRQWSNSQHIGPAQGISRNPLPVVLAGGSPALEQVVSVPSLFLPPFVLLVPGRSLLPQKSVTGLRIKRKNGQKPPLMRFLRSSRLPNLLRPPSCWD